MGRSRAQRHSCQNSAAALVASLFVLATPLFAAGQEILVDRLIAEVNGDPVTYSEVMDKVKDGPLVEVSPYPAEEKDAPFEVALQDAINKKLIMQKSSEFDIEITEEALDQEIERFLARRNLSMDGLRGALAEQGMTLEEYREDFRNQMVLRKFQGQVILPSVKITDKDVEVYYMRASGNASENLKLQLRQLFLKVDPAAADSIKKGKEQLAQTIYAKLKDGMPFEEAVKVYSDDPTARDTGGKMPPLALKDLASNFQSAIEPLSEGEFTPPIKTALGYYIFYLESKALGGSSDFDKKKKELEMQLTQEEVGRQTIKWLNDQRKRSKIRIIRDTATDSSPAGAVDGDHGNGQNHDVSQPSSGDRG